MRALSVGSRTVCTKQGWWPDGGGHRRRKCTTLHRTCHSCRAARRARQSGSWRRATRNCKTTKCLAWHPQNDVSHAGGLACRSLRAHPVARLHELLARSGVLRLFLSHQKKKRNSKSCKGCRTSDNVHVDDIVDRLQRTCSGALLPSPLAMKPLPQVPRKTRLSHERTGCAQSESSCPPHCKITSQSRGRVSGCASFRSSATVGIGHEESVRAYAPTAQSSCAAPSPPCESTAGLGEW